jgi:predicted alpha/beta hydrolase family esterase
MSMTRVILLHGNGGGSGKDNWFPWLQYKLKKIGIECEAPDLPDAIEAKSGVWLPYIQDVLKADENTILVGHSSGAIAAMRYAETHKLLGSILVGTYYTDLGFDDERASGYFDEPWKWKAIKNNQSWIIVFASTDDPYINIEEPRFIKDKLNAEYYEYKDKGHFGYDRDKVDFPELLNAIKSKLHFS